MATRPKPEGAKAPSSVVPIRRGRKVARENRPEDQDTIHFQRLRQKMDEKGAEETQDSRTAHALAAALASRIPAFNLRCIAGTLDEKQDFEVRCAEVEIAKAEADLAHAQALRLKALDPDADHEADFYKSNILWQRYRDRLLELARTPVRSEGHLGRKKALIGRFWLRCEGDWYDGLRAGVAADEAWLAEYMPKKKRERPAR